MTMQAAVFTDVEGTLLDGSLPRMALPVGRQLGMFSTWQLGQAASIMLLTRLLPRTWSLQVQMRNVVSVMGTLTLAQAAEISEALIPLVMQRLKGEVVKRVREHQQAGLPLVLVSGAMHPVIARLGVELGGRGEGTKLVERNGRFLPQLDGPACLGEGKAVRTRALLAEMECDPALSYAYGDTASDIPFLALFGHPCAVDPDPLLAAEAKLRGWPILRSKAAP
jgi:HAD superfamily phosphoserine phosphatase-like hydrolase